MGTAADNPPPAHTEPSSAVTSGAAARCAGALASDRHC